MLSIRVLIVAVMIVVMESLIGDHRVHSVCRGLAEGVRIDHVHACAEELQQLATEGQVGSLRKGVASLGELRNACDSTLEKGTAWGCKAISDLAYAIFAEATYLLSFCIESLGENHASPCDDRGKQASIALVTVWRTTEAQYQNTPVHGLVSSRLETLRGELFAPLYQSERVGDDDALPTAWHVSLRSIEKLKYWMNGYIWRETHWLWLMDSLQANRVVQTSWGTAEEWKEKFGANDCASNEPLAGMSPRYLFSDQFGMRWQILVSLLKDLRGRRDHEARLKVVEVGVFAGHLSHILLRDCEFVELLGVDPYIGRDGTFPGNFSETLDSDLALYKAASVMAPYSDRADLWTVTSEEAAGQLEDGSIDAVFIDGCHLYECVRQDFDLWLPKLRRGVEVLVAGHDFSPQWPGVVRAVHERRGGQQEVNLATDWMFWWFDRYD